MVVRVGAAPQLARPTRWVGVGFEIGVVVGVRVRVGLMVGVGVRTGAGPPLLWPTRYYAKG